MTHAVKEFTVNDKTFSVCGSPQDVYFQYLAVDDGLNEVAVRICESWTDREAVVLDVGANIGFTSSMFANEVPSGHVYGFEPSPQVFPRLNETLALNGFTNCSTYQLGMGKEPGALAFYDDPGSASASHIVSGDNAYNVPTTSIEVSTIDAFVKKEGLTRVDMIKIDVEGFELDVLAGAVETLARFRPKVYLEFNSFTLIAYGNLNPRFVIEKLVEIFPHVYTIRNGQFSEIRGPLSILNFLHANLTQHICVNDLYCSFEELVL